MVVSLFIDFSTVLCLVGQRGWECLYIKLKVSELWLWLGSLMCCLREKERERYEEPDVDEGKKKRWENWWFALSPCDFLSNQFPPKICLIGHAHLEASKRPNNMTLATLTTFHGRPPCLSGPISSYADSQTWHLSFAAVMNSYSSARAVSWSLSSSLGCRWANLADILKPTAIWYISFPA